MKRYRLDLAYDGTNFHGWASQDGLRTVQGTIEEWITKILRLETGAQLTVAGRTDAGVHARGQVAHIDLDEIDPAQLCYRLSRVLPEDITIYQISPAPEGFDARFSAIWRHYVYRIWDETCRPDPLLRGFTTQVRTHLDLDAMQLAGQALSGLRDFVAFCKHREGATTIRNLERLQVARVGNTIEVQVRSDAFCHSMVRSLVGALCQVGAGKRDISWITQLTKATTRSNEVPVMSGRGLTLEAVGYPPDEALATRARQARAKRELEETL